MNSGLKEYSQLVHDLYDYFHGGFSRPHHYDENHVRDALLSKPLQQKTPAVTQPASQEKTLPPPAQHFKSLQEISTCITSCQKCALAQTRVHVVPGEGVENPCVLVVGEGPGYHEDQQGRPFVGESGQYLDKWLESIALSREKNVYITNILKCRPPQNRDPQPEEIHMCRNYLEEQIRILKPQFILACGRFAAQFLCQKPSALAALRGKVHLYDNIPIIVTYHPSAVLRNPDLRRPVWEDLKALKHLIDKGV